MPDWRITGLFAASIDLKFSPYAFMIQVNREEQLLTTDGRSLEDKLKRLGVKDDIARVFGSRRDHSVNRVEQLRHAIGSSAPIVHYQDLCIFAAGSYARGEASQHSDIDLFFLVDDLKTSIEASRLAEIKVMSDIIDITEGRMKFPSPSNDGEFLRIASLKEMLGILGGREDDYKNHFTARMLMLLESVPLSGDGAYRSSLECIIQAYFRDYEDHAQDFKPTFIVNDILRFWKTLCLNYENKRNQASEAKKIKQKIRNFKLGYSRLLTCFATVALLSSYKEISPDEVIQICTLRPIDRLLMLAVRQPQIQAQLIEALEEYHWFLVKTSISTAELEAYFEIKENRTIAFNHARAFGNAMYQVVQTSAQRNDTLRYLVV